MIVVPMRYILKISQMPHGCSCRRMRCADRGCNRRIAWSHNWSPPLMGTKPQYRPKHLASKLLQIRKALGLSQTEMLRHLHVDHSFSPARLSEYESGTRTPSLFILM